MNRFTKYLTDLLPRTGRLITERGTFINQADFLEQARAGIDAFGQTQVVEYTSLIERKPLPGVTLQRDRVVPLGGNVAVANGQIVVDGTSELTTLYTVEYGRYIPGLFALCGIGYEIPTPGTGTYEFGYGNGSGNRIGINVTAGAYNTFVESGGVRYYTKSRAEWLDPLDGTGPSGITADISRATLRMVIGWYGTIPPEFYIVVSTRSGGTQKVLIDRAEVPVSGFVLEQPDLPIFCEATGGALNIGGRQFGVLGRYRPEFRITSGVNEVASVGTDYVPLVSFRIKAGVPFQGTPVRAGGLTVLTTNNAGIAIIIGGTLTGDSFVNVPGIDPSETALEIDTTATAISDGYLAYADKVNGGQGNTTGGGPSEVPALQIPRDQVVTLAGRASAGTTDLEAAFRMLEEW